MLGGEEFTTVPSKNIFEGYIKESEILGCWSDSVSVLCECF